MATYNYNLTLDVNPNANLPVITVKQFDDLTRILNITVTQDGEPFSFTSNNISRATFRLTKPNGAYVWLNASVDKTNNKVSVTLTSTSLGVAGRGYADVYLIDSSNRTISTMPFIVFIAVSPDVISKADASDDFQYLLHFIENADQVIAAAQEYATSAENSKNAIANMTASITMIGTDETATVVKQDNGSTFNLQFNIPYAHADYITFDINYGDGKLYMFRPVSSWEHDEISFAVNEETGNLEVVFDDGD